MAIKLHSSCTGVSLVVVGCVVKYRGDVFAEEAAAFDGPLRGSAVAAYMRRFWQTGKNQIQIVSLVVECITRESYELRGK